MLHSDALAKLVMGSPLTYLISEEKNPASQTGKQRILIQDEK